MSAEERVNFLRSGKHFQRNTSSQFPMTGRFQSTCAVAEVEIDSQDGKMKILKKEK